MITAIMSRKSDIAADTVNKVIGTAEKYNLISEGDNIVVALSGGADSVALLNILYSIKEKYNLTLYAAHLNHGIRGVEADNDEKFCKILCENYNIRFFVKHIDVPTLCAEQKISAELCGRNERYKYFDELSGLLNAKIATAHTASDNAETLLFNLSRGSSVLGASAIPPRRGKIIRPLIELSREEIEDFCTAKKLAYVTDSTNLSDEYTRNKIRHSVIPKLKEINPRVEQAMLDFSRDCSEVSGFLEQFAGDALNSAKEKYGYNSELLLQQNPAVLKAAIAKLCRENNADAERRHIELIILILNHGGAVELKNGKKAVCAQKTLRIIDNITENTSFCLVFDRNLSFEFLGKEIEANADFSALKPSKAVFRTRKSGDYFTFYKRNITKPLRKALNEQGVPKELRNTQLLLCDGSEVLWCEALGLSKRGKELSIEVNIR